MYTITILQNGDHQIIDRGFKFIVPSSTVIEAEAKRAEGQNQTLPTDVIVFSAKLPEFRDGIIKGVPSATLRKTY